MPNSLITKLSDYWKALPAARKTSTLTVGGIVLAVLAGLSILAKNDPYQVLYTDLQPEESRAVMKKLSDQKIPYDFGDDKSTVRVPASQVANARMQLAKDGIPGQDVVGFEKFDGSTLGMSSYVQRIQYVRAVQGELTRSINRLNSVKSSRVHLSVPPKKTFMEDEDPPKASVVLELHSGLKPSKTEITGIAHLVASAVEGLKVNQVTIVDTKGNFLHRPEEAAGNAISSNLLEMQRSIETEYEKRVEEMLIPVVGFGKVRAKVTVEIDPSRTNTTEETFDPEKQVVKNMVRNDEISAGRPGVGGVPGSRSNLPGQERRGLASSPTTERNSQNTSYAYPRKVQIIDKPSGNIKRLTVAVLVDGHYSKSPAGASETFLPRSEEELRRLQDIVANAVGYDAQRRDSINVSSMPFRAEEEVLSTVPETSSTPWWSRQENMLPLARNTLIALGMFLVFMTIVRPAFRVAFSGPAPKSTPTTHYPRTVAEMQGTGKQQAQRGGLARALGDSDSPLRRDEEDLRQKIVERLAEAPRKGIRIIQDWLDETTHTTEA